MEIVDKFLNKHHFFNKPHKWFIAVLASPIHAAEVHYKKKYHMKFGHARKLFIFDMFLVVSIFVLGGLAAYWHLYDPTVVENVNLEITQQTHGESEDSNKIKSGEHIKYTINYKNNSEKTLNSPRLTVQKPEHFDLLKTSPSSTFNKQNSTFTLPKLPPGAKGKVSIEGFYFGKPKEHEQVAARLQYNQADREKSEERLARAITILQGSYVQAEINTPDKILAEGESEMTIKVTNNGHHTMREINIPLPQKQSWRVAATNTVQKGEIKNNNWSIPEIKSGEELVLTTTLVSTLPEGAKNAVVQIGPEIMVNNRPVPQTTQTNEIEVIKPEVQLSTAWNKTTPLDPGSSRDLNINIKNNSNADLSNLELIVPIDNNIIDISELRRNNVGIYKNKQFTVSYNHSANLKTLAANEQKDIEISLPTKRLINSGINHTLKPTIKLKSQVEGVKDSTYQTEQKTKSIKINSTLNINSEVRYYTKEGDQLGRGPLPPKVGEPTKYWVFVNINNTSNNVEKISFSATLPDYVNWTEKSSVSTGRDLNYNKKTNTVSWFHNSLKPHTQASIYFRLELNPKEKHRNSTPVILRNVYIQGNDSYTNQKINNTFHPLDVSLTKDEIGRNKGVKVR